LFGPGIVVVATLGGTMVGRGSLPALSSLATVALRLSISAVLTGLLSIAVPVSSALGSGLAIAGGSINIFVFAPGLSAPLVLVVVVPFVVRLGGIRLGVGLAIGLRDAQVLISAPSVPIGSSDFLGISAIRT